MITETLTSRKASPQNFTGRCFLVFSEGRVFGLPVEQISTVFQVNAITPVPLAPPEVLGLVNLRGKVVVAISLRRRLRDELAPEDSKLAVGIDHLGESFALVVDEVGDVLQLEAATVIERPPHLGSEQMKLWTVHRVGDQILPVLDLDWLFAVGTKAPPAFADLAIRSEGRDN